MAELDLPTGDRTLLMAFDAEKEAVGLLLDHTDGVYVRGDGAWRPVSTRNPYFADVEVVPVEEEFLTVFDKLDAKGSEPTYKQAQTYKMELEVPEPEDAPEPVEEPELEEETEETE